MFIQNWYLNNLANLDSPIIAPCYSSYTIPGNQSLKTQDTKTLLTQVARTSVVSMSFLLEFQFIFCLVILFGGFFGNLLVIITFCSRGARLKVCEILMISLAIGDLLGTLSIPLLTILTLKTDVSVLGHFGCQFINWLNVTSLTASAFSLVAICIDRFIIVIWPLRNRPRPWKVIIVAILIWIAASTLGIIYFLRVSYSFENKRCAISYIDDTEDLIHTVSLFLIQMMFPIIIMSALYGIILCRLKSSSVRKLSVHSSFFKVRQKRNRKSTKLFLTVVIIFYVVTLPYNIFYLWYTMNWRRIPAKDTLTIQYIFHILLLILLSNSCVNPLIYARLHKSFRRNTLRVLCPCLLKRFPKFLGHSFNRTLSSSSSSRWRSRSSYRGSTSTTTTMSPSATPSPRHSPEPLFPPPAYKELYSIPDAENKGDSTYALHPLGSAVSVEDDGNPGNAFDPLRHDDTELVTSPDDNEYYAATNLAGVSYLTAEETAEVHTGKNGCILSESEKLCKPENNGSSARSSPCSAKKVKNVRFLISNNQSDTLLGNTEEDDN